MAGILIKPARGLSIGASIYGGATFDLEATLFGRFVSGDSVANLEDQIRNGDVLPISYVVPPRLGTGVSWRITDPFTVVFDANRILYSRQVNETFQIVDFQAAAFQLSPDNFYVRDVWEIHAGAEYRIYKPSFTFALRAGAFTDPDHSLRFRQGSAPLTIATRALDFRLNSVPDETDVGTTVGLGIMFANRFQVDAAASFSKDANEVVVSFVIRP
jgi:long-subunit fatty acid transport protein